MAFGWEPRFWKLWNILRKKIKETQTPRTLRPQVSSPRNNKSKGRRVLLDVDKDKDNFENCWESCEGFVGRIPSWSHIFFQQYHVFISCQNNTQPEEKIIAGNTVVRNYIEWTKLEEPQILFSVTLWFPITFKINVFD